MTDEGFHERPGYVPDDVPTDRCGYTTDYEEKYWLPGNVTCWREPWNHHDRCIWHAGDEYKPTDELAEIRVNSFERFDGAVLRGVELGNPMDFVDCFLIDTDLTDADLEWADFTGANLRRASLTGASLKGANFTDASLSGADLTDADLRAADLTDAVIREADLTDAFLGWVDLTDASLRDADLTDAFLGGYMYSDGADLTNASLRDADLTNAHFGGGEFSDGADLTDADLAGADLTDAFLHSANLTNASLRVADLTNATLRRSSLTDAFLRGANFIDASLVEADLTDADLRGATLLRADLTDADLRGATLLQADLTDADLADADLTDADLADADLTDAGLRGAILLRADLENASLESADLDGTDFTDTRLYNCRLQDVYVSEETTFGNRCIYEQEVHETIEANGLTEDELEPIEQAISIYRTYQRLLRENSLPGDISHYFYREKDMRRLRARAAGDRLDWGYRELQKWVMGYGERPWRVVGTSLAVIVGFGLAYPFAGGMEAADGDTVAFRLVEGGGLPLGDGTARIVFENLYFSAVTFSTLGYGDIQPGSDTVQLLASVQSLLGALLMALLVAVLARRITR